MAAYAALVSLMNLVHEIEHHPSPPITLDKQLLDPISQHITFFQKFLHAYNPPLDEEGADPLEMRIASAAYAAEDAIESHIVDTIQQQLQRSNSGLKYRPVIDAGLKNTRSINLHDSLQCVIEEIDSIKNVAVGIKADTEEKKVVHYQLVATTNVLASVALSETNDAMLEIMEKLIGGRHDCQIIPIVGMGGIGKTFLAKSIYASPLIKDHFYVCAWATISQQYNTGDILRDVLSHARNIKKEELSKKSEDELGSELHKYLFGRRFLIVLDDMWSIDAWDKIHRFFPNNENGSRVLITTRLSQLSSQLNNDYSLHMSFLDKASSWELFSKTVFGDKSCPRELKEIGEKIVDHCRGLPLSIAVVGGLLKKMGTNRASWESIQDNLSSTVNMENDKHCLKLLKMSYYHLPVYLKPCFLYMGVFDEDDEIFVSTLVKLWVSEGFLKPANNEALKTTARGFLQDLIDRNLILIHKLGSTGSTKSCKIHDLLRDLCLKEVQKEGFYHVIGQCNPPPPQGMNTQRRVVIPRNSCNKKVDNELRSMSHARSIICEYGGKMLSFQDVRLLRTLQVLHHENLPEYFDKSGLKSLVFGHVNLRHLNMEANTMSEFQLLPSLVSHIWNLHTLKVPCSDEEYCLHTFGICNQEILFSDFWKMTQFRHIEFGCDPFQIPDPPTDGVIMENLHTLKGVKNFKCCEEVVKRIPNIKKLKLLYYSNDEGEDFVENIGSLCGMESLFLKFWNSYTNTDNKHKLTFPHSLKKLTLRMSDDFEWEDHMMQKIGSLPRLEKLKLYEGCFRKGEWETAEGQFPCLKYLKLEQCRGLKNWMVAEEGSDILPRLEKLRLCHLDGLKRIPCELGNIDTLKSIKLIECGEGSVMSAKEMVNEQEESQGEDQLSFRVLVKLRIGDNHLRSLEGPNFEVRRW